MNIHDIGMWTTNPELFVGDVLTWEDLIGRRVRTAAGFAALEQNRGFLKPRAYLSTSQGQEMLRILFFRVLEEATESMMAQDPDHKKEEIIDSFNYLLTAALLDPKLYGWPDDTKLAELLNWCTEMVWKDPRQTTLPENIQQEDLAVLTYLICGELADTFRNRAWMEHAQDPYFSGGEIFNRVLKQTTMRFLRCFSSFDEFARYYISKDNVLSFRLRSSY